MALTYYKQAILAILALPSFYFSLQTCQSYPSLMKCYKMYPAINKAYNDSAFETKATTSVITCGRDCTLESGCVSFNFHTQTNLCKLNKHTKVSYPDKLITIPRSIYYDFAEDTPSYSYSTCLMFSATHHTSGIYTIVVPKMADGGLQVYCDMETDGGGWIVFQRRQDGSVDFYRNWEDYQSGFGNLMGEFWLGNDALVSLTKSGLWQLQVDIEDWKGNTAQANYGEFSVSGRHYELHVGQYQNGSTAGDSLTDHNGYSFTTMDMDHDGLQSNCALALESAWWFSECGPSHLNGKYHHNVTPFTGYGVQWSSWKGRTYSFKQCSMKIREIL